MKITVPFSPFSIHSEEDFGKLLSELRRLRAERVFMVLGDLRNFEEKTEVFRRFHERFAAEHIEDAVWIPTIFHFTACGEPFTKMVSLNGHGAGFCPTDPAFVTWYCGILTRLAGTGVKTIVLDDDFRLNMVAMPAQCFCERHLALYSEVLGEKVTPESMREKMFSGGCSRYRQAWMDVTEKTLCDFADAIRREMDKTDPGLQLILCSGPALWGCDGEGPIAAKIARRLAPKGKRPVLRLSGGPYWERMLGMTLCDQVMLTRCEVSALKGEDIELLGEDDVYPRPRCAVPAKYLVFFQSMLEAADGPESMLKYALDYNADISNETGYAALSEKYDRVSDFLQEHFSGKCRGFRPYEDFRASADAQWSPEDAWRGAEQYSLQTHPAISYLNDISVPASTERGEPLAVFGESAKTVTPEELKNGAILDLVAAKRLQTRGIDVGLVSDNGVIEARSDNWAACMYEKFPDGTFYAVSGEAHDLTVSERAEPHSRLLVGGEWNKEEKTYSGSYFYENADGMRFLVLPFDGKKNVHADGLLRGYGRQREAMTAYRRFTGTPLPAMLPDCPDVYQIVRQGEGGELCIGIWNCSKDEILSGTVRLSDTYQSARFFDCDGVLEPHAVKLTREIPPCSFAAVILKK